MEITNACTWLFMCANVYAICLNTDRNYLRIYRLI